jgi:transcriptional regulator with XRE-family HTH domain
MVGKATRDQIKKQYRIWRIAANKTQLDVQELARLDVGRYWKIENGVTAPTAYERQAIARVLKVEPSALPFFEAVA